MSDVSEPSVVLANLSARQAKEMGLLTSGTYGPQPFTSSESRGLTISLANRLRPRTDLLGSTLYALTWKERETPSGFLISALRASVPRRSDSDLTSPLIPREAFASSSLKAGWPAPTTPSGGQKVPEGTSATGRRPDGSKATVTTAHVAAMAGWPTPKAISGGANSKREERGAGGPDLQEAVRLAGWPTSRATDADKNIRTADGALNEMERKGSIQDLPGAAAISGWSTPSTRDWKDTPGMTYTRSDGKSRLDQLPRQAQLVDFGGMQNGSLTEAASGARLNPEHSRWLQGVPVSVALCEPMATASTWSRQPTSSSAILRKSGKPRTYLADEIDRLIRNLESL